MRCVSCSLQHRNPVQGNPIWRGRNVLPHSTLLAGHLVEFRADLTMKLPPRVEEFSPKLTDPATRQAEPLGDFLVSETDGQRFRDATFRPGLAVQPRIQTDEHFYQVARYGERNALRADLVPSAEPWRCSSLCRRVHGSAEQVALLSSWPLPQPRNWKLLVNQPQHECESEAIRRCIRRGQPFGSQSWVERTASQLGLESTLRAPHRPRKIPRAETAET